MEKKKNQPTYVGALIINDIKSNVTYYSYRKEK